jgi:hypothetical protein
LLHDYHVEVLEELGQLYYCLLDALDFVVALADGVEGALGLAAAVGVE